ncbi:MAG TPA: hypothetical protein VN715_21010 [Roseiarcus sp.]|nr:hypothetical protein [Roseiarcus sp.]
MRAFLIALALLAGLPAQAAVSALNDYPTDARADYVFACMKTNGETHDALERCSCSIDVIASLLPYDAYVSGETVASMIQDSGAPGRAIKASALARSKLVTLRRAQAESEIRCF